VTVVTPLPVSGIVVHSADIVAGHGCGTGPDQVYEYAALLSYKSTPSDYIASAVVPCYADAVFSSIPSPDMDAGGGSTSLLLQVRIAAYNFASAPPALGCAVAAQVGTAAIATPPCPGDVPDATAPIALAAPNWTTTCSAHQLTGVPVQAQCCPLQPGSAGTTECAEIGDAGDAAAAADGPGGTGANDGDATPPATITLSTQAFRVEGGGGVVTCGVDYRAVAATWQTDDASTQNVVDCPAPLALFARPGASYAISLELLKERGGPAIARTQCAATTLPATNTLAWCADVQLVR
jgi:hypothetical protein